MENYLKTEHAGAFGPEDVKLLISAYEDALTVVRASDTYLEEYFGSVREVLAWHIVQAAIAGERDPIRLRDAGLRRLQHDGKPRLDI